MNKENYYKYIDLLSFTNELNKDLYSQHTAFSFKKYCSSLVIVVKILIFAHSDAEAPP